MGRTFVQYLESLLFRIWSPFTFLRLDEADKLIDKLEREIRNSGYNPEIVVTVMRDGYYPAKELARRLDIDLATMRVSHYAIPIGRFEIDEIPYAYRIAKKLGYKPQVRILQNVDKDITSKRVLVVDDGYYTGLTMKTAIDHVKSKNPNEVRCAVLLMRNENSATDYAALSLSEDNRRRLRMPWFRASPYFVDVWADGQRH